MRSSLQTLRHLSIVAVALPLTVLVGVTWYESRSWPIVHDLPIMLYMAFIIERFGVVPHVGFFDMNTLGSYAAYVSIGRMTGYAPDAIRSVDASVFAAITAASVFALRPLSAAAGWIAAMLFGAFYLQFGPQMSLQREYLMIPFLLASTGAALRQDSRPFPWWAALSGVALGMAVTIKPQAIVLGLPLVVYLMVEGHATGRAFARGGAFIGGLALPPVALLATLIRLGAADAFLDIAVNYLPLYGALDGSHRALLPSERPWYLLSQWTAFGHIPRLTVVAASAAVSAIVVLAADSGDAGRRRRILLVVAMTIVCSAYPVVSGQFWLYHWLPFVYFAMASIALLAAVPVSGQGWRWLVPVALLAGITTLVARPLVAETIPHTGPNKNGNPERMAAFLRANLLPGDSVQPMDWTAAGALHGLLLAEARPATSFLYDFHFYHHVSSPYTRRLRRRFLREFEAAQPRFVIRGHAGPFPSGPDTNREFPQFEQLLRESYVPVLSEADYTIYRRVSAGADEPE